MSIDQKIEIGCDRVVAGSRFNALGPDVKMRGCSTEHGINFLLSDVRFESVRMTLSVILLARNFQSTPRASYLGKSIEHRVMSIRGLDKDGHVSRSEAFLWTICLEPE